LDPRDFTLVAFGGNGALHACSLAQELGMRTIVIPPRSGLFSAYGLLVAPLQATSIRPLMLRNGALDDAQTRALFAELERTTAAALQQPGADPATVAMQHEFDMRYAGQSFELSIPAARTAGETLAAFHRRHHETYGYSVQDEPVEFVNARVSATAPVAAAGALAPPARSEAEPLQRPVWIGGAPVEVAVMQRDALGERAVEGPAIIEQYDACTYVAPGWSARADGGDLLVERSA
jgi:N-methylhydantoinase A